ncbi:hypothetical protein LXA43DRAFT_1101676 [Ganoderma leucocontextum]|nr:hypothetical protein LXA43DRAFT_1101676 [Ganoderma leucocontextum]
MKSSAFSPTQFAGAAYSYPSTAPFYDGSTVPYTSSSCLDGFVYPQSSTWSHTPLGWSYPGSEQTSISDVELYETFLTGELAQTEAFPHEPYTDSSDASIHPDIVRALAHNTPYNFPVQTPPHDHEYTVSVQYDAFNPAISQPAPIPHAYKQSCAVAATPCIAPTLIEVPMHLKHDLGPGDDEIATYAAPQNARRTHTFDRANICASSGSPSPYASPSPEPYSQPSSELIACRRRNAPALPSTVTSSNRWKCPHCLYVQRNRRSPDLKRHVQTHTRGAHVAVWVCCGVPTENAVELGVPSEVVCDAPLFDFDGVTMIGGCRKVFSRRDALIRHLRKRKGACFGDAGALYQPGNRLVLYS